MGKGRPRKEGSREPNGRISRSETVAPNARVLAARRVLSADPTLATTPADVAMSRGWLTMEEHRAGERYAALTRRVGLIIGRFGSANGRLEVDPKEVDYRKFSEMTHAEIVAVWDQTFNADDAPGQSREAADMDEYRRLSACMTEAERREVSLIFVHQSWPQWLIKRLANEIVYDAAKAERRQLTDDEVSRVTRRTAEGRAKYQLLRNALTAISLARKAPTDAVQDGVAA